ncbi:MAG: hypothetical protein AAF532_03635 [Planctomycetota bacterium]
MGRRTPDGFGSVDRYGFRYRPLRTWPGDRRRQFADGQFRRSLDETLADLFDTLRHISGRNVVIEVDVPPEDFRVDGSPRARATVGYPGVIVSADTRFGPKSYPSDKYRIWHHNVRAVVLHLEALRAVGRHEVGESDAQYGGNARLPHDAGVAAGSDTTRTEADARVVLVRLAGLTTAKLPSELKGVVRRARARCHPDRNNGDPSLWKQLEDAIVTVERHYGVRL